MSMGSVLLATDGSEYARTAARRAIELAEDRGTPLQVICVVDSQRFSEPALSSTELTTIYAEEHAALCVGEVEEMTADRDLSVAGDTHHGVPPEVILESAAEVDADVIVIGEHGDHTKHFSGVVERVAQQAD